MLNKPKFFLKRIEGRVGSASACFSVSAIMRTSAPPRQRTIGQRHRFRRWRRPEGAALMRSQKSGAARCTDGSDSLDRIARA